MNKTIETKIKENQKSVKNIIIMSLFAGFLLLLTNSAAWVNNQIFNTDNFTNTVTTSLTSESSRVAISQNITDKIFIDKPIAKRVAGDFSTKIIGGLLATDQFSSVVSTAAERMQVYVTSNNQEDVTIELGGVKDILAQLTNVSESLGREVSIDSSNIPDRITLIEEKDIPDLYLAGVVMLWIAPVTLIFALVLLVYPYVKRGDNRKYILLQQGIVVTLVSFMGYLIGPLFRPPVLAQISVENRVVIGNLYDAFIATFNNQTAFVTLSGITMIVIATILISYPRLRTAYLNTKK